MNPGQFPMNPPGQIGMKINNGVKERKGGML